MLVKSPGHKRRDNLELFGTGKLIYFGENERLLTKYTESLLLIYRKLQFKNHNGDPT